MIHFFCLDAQDELDCVREPFINRRYFSADKHKTLLQRLRKQIKKKTPKLSLPTGLEFYILKENR